MNGVATSNPGIPFLISNLKFEISNYKPTNESTTHDLPITNHPSQKLRASKSQITRTWLDR